MTCLSLHCSSLGFFYRGTPCFGRVELHVTQLLPLTVYPFGQFYKHSPSWRASQHHSHGTSTAPAAHRTADHWNFLKIQVVTVSMFFSRLPLAYWSLITLQYPHYSCLIFEFSHHFTQRPTQNRHINSASNYSYLVYWQVSVLNCALILWSKAINQRASWKANQLCSKGRVHN